MKTKEHRSAAVTGAGSGLGRDIALGLAAKDYQVFGTAMAVAEIADLREASAGRVDLRVCDITEEKSVQNWVRGVSDVLGESGVDLLVSNAGILTPGPLEFLRLAAVRHEFEVNVFGSLAVINAFLPALRKARGRIVQIGAMTGRFPIPFNGPSSASKATLEAFADIYRAELKPFGVDFIIAQAGNLLTGGPAKTAAALKRVSDSMTSAQRELYGQTFDKFAAALNSMQGSGLPSVEAAMRVIELAEQTPAPSRAPVGADAEKILQLVHDKSDAQLDLLRLQLVGLN
jgi:NAD(P)-dependent dehydrogenase (short-subunit alcohol dehydrogenase family)